VFQQAAVALILTSTGNVGNTALSASLRRRTIDRLLGE
jgi:hypothetical protein